MSEETGVRAMWKEYGQNDPKQLRIDQEIEYFMVHFFDNARNIVYERELKFQREREQAYRDYEDQKNGNWNYESLVKFCKYNFRMSDKNARISAEGSDKIFSELNSSDFPKLSSGFWLHGKEGSHKTCTAGAIAVEYMKGLKLKSNQVIFYQWRDLYSMSEKTKGYNSQSSYSKLLEEKLEGVRILIIDDFFRTDKSNIPDQFEFALSMLEYVIKDKICLIITSNASPDELENYERKNTLGDSAPVVSRASRYCKPIQFNAEDGRSSW